MVAMRVMSRKAEQLELLMDLVVFRLALPSVDLQSHGRVCGHSFIHHHMEPTKKIIINYAK